MDLTKIPVFPKPTGGFWEMGKREYIYLNVLICFAAFPADKELLLGHSYYTKVMSCVFTMQISVVYNPHNKGHFLFYNYKKETLSSPLKINVTCVWRMMYNESPILGLHASNFTQCGFIEPLLLSHNVRAL